MKKELDSFFDATMGSYYGAGFCELIVIYIQSLMGSTLEKDLIGSKDLIILHNTNSQQTVKIRKVFLKVLTSKLKLQVDFFDITFNLERNTYRPYKKPKDNLTYIKTS